MAKQYYVRFIFAAICMIIAGGLQAALPLISKPAIDEIFVSKNIAALKWIPFAVIARVVLISLCSFCVGS